MFDKCKTPESIYYFDINSKSAKIKDSLKKKLERLF
jgi:hypothetical protein